MNVEPEEMDLLQRRAESLGLYINEHRNYDTTRGNGPLYIMERRKFRDEKCTTFIKYATPQQCWDFFQIYEDVKRETGPS